MTDPSRPGETGPDISSWAAARLVAAREIRQTLRGKAFWTICGLLLLAATAGMILPEVLSDDGPTTYEVAVVDGSPALVGSLEQVVAALDGELEVTVASDLAQARQLVTDDEVDVAIVDGEVATVLVQAGEHDTLVGAVRQAIATKALAESLADEGLARTEIEDLMSAEPARVEELDAARADRRGAAFMLSLAMYLILLMLMMSVANGVAVEKANRISEVLLAIVRPGSLLFGKVLGVAIIGVLTMACGAGPLLVKFAVGGDLPEGLGGALAGGAVWFVLGGALYLVLAGSLSALIERQEEAGSVVGPLSVVLVAGYLIGGSAPETTAAQVLGYIPLTSPMAMPSRIAVGAASGAEMVVSALISLLAVVVAARVGAIVYQRAIVRTGRRLKLRDVLRA